jgi:hypothetical protein
MRSIWILGCGSCVQLFFSSVGFSLSFLVWNFHVLVAGVVCKREPETEETTAGGESWLPAFGTASKFECSIALRSLGFVLNQQKPSIV